VRHPEKGLVPAAGPADDRRGMADGTLSSTMSIKGTAFLSKKNQIVLAHGEPGWLEFLASLAQELPFFDRPVIASTLIPVGLFLQFQDRMLAWFYQGKAEAYWGIGARSADWALGPTGPYRAFLTSRDSAGFAHRFPALWTMYFTESAAHVDVRGNVVQVQARGLPVWHGYFEYMVMGYLKRGFELLGNHVEVTCLTPPKTRDYAYRFVLT
jgi:hypothetical protein